MECVNYIIYIQSYVTIKLLKLLNFVIKIASIINTLSKLIVNAIITH